MHTPSLIQIYFGGPLTKNFANVGVMHIRTRLEDLPSFFPRPYHEGVHWSFYVRSLAIVDGSGRGSILSWTDDFGTKYFICSKQSKGRDHAVSAISDAPLVSWLGWDVNAAVSCKTLGKWSINMMHMLANILFLHLFIKFECQSRGWRWVINIILFSECNNRKEMLGGIWNHYARVNDMLVIKCCQVLGY